MHLDAFLGTQFSQARIQNIGGRTRPGFDPGSEEVCFFFFFASRCFFARRFCFFPTELGRKVVSLKISFRILGLWRGHLHFPNFSPSVSTFVSQQLRDFKKKLQGEVAPPPSGVPASLAADWLPALTAAPPGAGNPAALIDSFAQRQVKITARSSEPHKPWGASLNTAVLFLPRSCFLNFYPAWSDIFQGIKN